MKKKTLYIPLLLLIIIFNGCITEKHAIPDAKERAKFFIVWAHSDIQPKNIKERAHYETAVADVKDNLVNIDMGVIAGDIIQRKVSTDDYKWFLRTRQIASVPLWYEIAGNHDARNFANYFKFIKKPLYYSVYIGNVLFIFLSDEVNSSPTEISDYSYNWWRNEVISNQDKTIITVTHAYLPESGLLFSRMYRSRVLKSGRFVEVLKKFRVDLWISGHTTLPTALGYNENIVEEYHNILFLNVSSIRRDFNMPVISRFLIFKMGSSEMQIKMRNHTKERFIRNREFRIRMRAPFIYEKPRMVIPDGVITVE